MRQAEGVPLVVDRVFAENTSLRRNKVRLYKAAIDLRRLLDGRILPNYR